MVSLFSHNTYIVCPATLASLNGISRKDLNMQSFFFLMVAGTFDFLIYIASAHSALGANLIESADYSCKVILLIFFYHFLLLASLV